MFRGSATSTFWSKSSRPSRFAIVGTDAFRRQDLLTVRVTVAVCVLPPPVPGMVMVRFPVLAVLLTVTVIFDVPEPGAAIDVGLKLTVSPDN